jgi:hypothetical protein
MPVAARGAAGRGPRVRVCTEREARCQLRQMIRGGMGKHIFCVANVSKICASGWSDGVAGGTRRDLDLA